jgi:acyl dehydratase
MVGTVTGRSRWFRIDQDRIDAFAEATENRHWIHTDREAAKDGPFGTTIAHGFLTLSLLDKLLDEAAVLPEGTDVYVNYGSDKVRYLAPVPPGTRIRAVNTLTDITERSSGRILLTNHVVVEIDGEESPALVGDILYLAITDD